MYGSESNLERDLLVTCLLMELSWNSKSFIPFYSLSGVHLISPKKKNHN